MKINIQSIHFDANRKLLNFIEEKTAKLPIFYEQVIGCDVFLKLDKSSESDNKIVEIKVHIPGNSIFAKKQCKSFEEATDLVIEAIKTQLKKSKEKLKEVNQ